jgi:hypothetical protein
MHLYYYETSISLTPRKKHFVDDAEALAWVKTQDETDCPVVCLYTERDDGTLRFVPITARRPNE